MTELLLMGLLTYSFIKLDCLAVSSVSSKSYINKNTKMTDIHALYAYYICLINTDDPSV